MKINRALILLIHCSLLFNTARTQNPDYTGGILQWQQELQAQYAGTHSPLPEKEKAVFEGIFFFETDARWLLTARFQSCKAQKIPFPTSAGTTKYYTHIGYLHFSVPDGNARLNLYQGADADKKWFFLPFKDFTNGSETYGGGKYVDMEWKKLRNGDTISVDFNRSYFPYCAYTSGYSCPLVPEENILPFPVRAGVRWKP